MLREPVRVLDKGSGGGKTADKVSTGLRHVERKLGAGASHSGNLEKR